MRRKLIFHSLVRPEIREAKQWYNKQRQGLGTEVVDAIEAQLDRVRDNPEGFGFVAADVRVAIVSRFPYAVYFQIRQSRVQVIAVVHTSRDASVWQSRL